MTPDPNPRFVARVASYEPLLPGFLFAVRGRVCRYTADWYLSVGRLRDAERLYRQAIERLVDAFLVDRKGQSSCFTEAHEIGKLVNELFGCPLSSGDGGDNWSVNCGVLALHQRIGSSWGGTSRGECSVCQLEDFQCHHVPGKYYGGQRCYRIVAEVDLDEVSLVQFPRDPRCYRVELVHTREFFENGFDIKITEGVTPLCEHCAQCESAAAGPTREDLDQSLWPPIGGRQVS